jgi:hypothetical protein
LSVEDISGSIIFKGKLQDKPGDVSFRESFVKNNDQFVVVCGGAGGSAIIWKRFQDVYVTDYFYMSCSNYDAACFIPKRKVAFKGFGIYQNYFGNQMKLKVKWIIGEEHSEEFELELNHEERDLENHWHTFELQSVGEKAVVVEEGQEIHCLIKVMDSSDMRKCIYGYNGYKDRYSKFEF